LSVSAITLAVITAPDPTQLDKNRQISVDIKVLNIDWQKTGDFFRVELLRF